MKNLLVLPSAAGGNVVNTGNTAEQAALFLNSTGTIFRKGGKVMSLEKDLLVEVKPPMAETMLFSLMNVQKWAGRGQNVNLVPATEIKDTTLHAILEGHYVKQHIREITVVARRPYLVLSGDTLVSLKVGYNPERGGILVTGKEMPVEVPLEEAVPAISALFDDFHFATPSDRSRAIAAVLCAALRMAGIYERHPLLVFEADFSQTGKTLLWAMLCAIFGQRYGSVVQKRGGVGSLDETLMDKLVAGHGFILYDNVRGRVDSPFLEACLTPETGDLDARVLGRKIPVDPRPVVIGMTSNAAEVTSDLANRSFMVRICKQPGHYKFRVWTNEKGEEVGIREHIESRQAYYHGCVNAIVRDWWAKGAQRLPCTEHSFKQTIGALDFMTQTYFKTPPLLDGHQGALDRTSMPGLSWLRHIAIEACNRWHVVDWTASKLAERCALNGIVIPGANGPVESMAAAQLVGVAMANAFGTAESITVDGAVVVSRKVEKDSKGRDYKLYSFTKVGG